MFFMMLSSLLGIVFLMVAFGLYVDIPGSARPVRWLVVSFVTLCLGLLYYIMF